MKKLTAKIMVAGQKGGVGKSAVTRALAVMLITDGQSVCVRDFDDGQLTVTEWASVRKENGTKPAIRVQSSAGEISTSLQIFDCPGWSSERTLLIAQRSDFVVLPSGPSTADDLTPTINLAFELEEAGFPLDHIMIVLNRIHNNEQATRARRFIQESDSALFVVDGDIRESTHVASLHDVGRTVLDIKSEREQKRAVMCLRSIIDRIKDLGPRDETQIPSTLSIDL